MKLSNNSLLLAASVICLAAIIYGAISGDTAMLVVGGIGVLASCIAVFAGIIAPENEVFTPNDVWEYQSHAMEADRDTDDSAAYRTAEWRRLEEGEDWGHFPG